MIDVPAWIEAVGTDAAFIVVSVTLALQLQDRRAEQASQIDYHVFAASKTDYPGERPPERPPLGLSPDEYGKIWVTIRNRSLNPVNDFIVSLPWGTTKTKSLGKIPPGEFTLAYATIAGDFDTRDRLSTLIPVVQFRDKNGKLWQRNANGTLRRINVRRKAYALK